MARLDMNLISQKKVYLLPSTIHTKNDECAKPMNELKS